MSIMDEWRRTHHCGELTATNTGMPVILNGWVHNWRNHGGIIFIDVRDRWGVTQVVFNPADDAALAERASVLRHEFVIAAAGVVRKRPENMANPKMATGENRGRGLGAADFQCGGYSAPSHQRSWILPNPKNSASNIATSTCEGRQNSRQSCSATGWRSRRENICGIRGSLKSRRRFS